jgi:5S rRNA maturation endonuclease (ribonuclease M5)
MNTKVAYIIAEGKFDAELIKQLLSDQSPNIGVLAAPNYSSALSIAESVLLQTKRPVLLIIDSDTTDEIRIREKRTFIEQYVRINGMTCQVAFAVPALEVLFFADKSAFEEALGKSISDDVWTLARLSPKQGIELLVGKSREIAVGQLLENKSLRQKIAQTPLVKEINTFIQEALQPVSA